MTTPTLDCACRVQISVVGIVTSLKPCVPLESTTVVAQNRVVMEPQTITRAVFVRVWMVTSYAQLGKFG